MKTTIYSPEPILRHPGKLFHEMFADLWAGRELAWRLMMRNFSAQYRQTALGYVWAFLPPFLAAGTFIFLRQGGILTVGTTDIPYVPWVLIGSFLWQTFADAINGPMRQVSQAKAMLTKINFPREALIMAGIGETLLNFLIRLVILVPILVIFQLMPTPSLLLFPLPLFVLITLGSMIGLLLTPAAVLYQDIEKGIPLLLPFLMILCGAVVPIPREGLGQLLASINPIYPPLETCRALLTGQPAVLWPQTLLVAAIAVVLLFLGWILYRLAMPHLIARLGG
jgi:lipopolysaccharide transport system permease protein